MQTTSFPSVRTKHLRAGLNICKKDIPRITAKDAPSSQKETGNRRGLENGENTWPAARQNRFLKPKL